MFKTNSSPIEVLNLIKSTGKRLFPFQGSYNNEELKFEDCEYLPKGWKRAKMTFTGDHGDTRQGYFLYKSPDINLFPSEGSVLRKLRRGKEVDESDVQKLRNKLISDGWSTNKTLPDNYLFRKHEFGTAFMDP